MATEPSKVVSGVAKGAVDGAIAGFSVAGSVAIGLPIASVAAGSIALSAGATAATSLGIMSAGLAIGSAIPIPVLGTVIGFIAGAIGAVVSFFNNRPSPAFARALLAVFRYYPNVLREWVNERETFGIPHDHSALRSRWGYVSMLREEAGETGPDPFEDEQWRRRFEAGRVDPTPPATPPDLRVLGIVATTEEAESAARALSPLLDNPALKHVSNITVTAVDGPHGPAVSVALRPRVYVPQGLTEPPAPPASRPSLFVYGKRTPMVSVAQPPELETVVPGPDVTERAEKLRAALAAVPLVRGVDVVPLRVMAQPDGSGWGFAIRVSPGASASQRADAQALAAVFSSSWTTGARDVLVLDDPSVAAALASSSTPTTTAFPPSAEVTARADKLRAALAPISWVRGVDVVVVRSSPLPDDGAYGFSIRLSPSATPAQHVDVRKIASLVTAAFPAGGARTVVVASDRGVARPVLVIGGVLTLAAIVAIAWPASRPPTERSR